MKLRHVSIQNFRGIRQLDWTVRADVVCLVGPGDSTKTSILDAISYALSPRWALPISHADFYDADPEEPITIAITIAGLPEQLISENKFGLYLRGCSEDGALYDDPDGDCEAVLTVQLTVDESLEPKWTVVKNAVEERPISAADREKLKVFRVDERSDHHLGWGRGSALAALTGDLDRLPMVLAQARRTASAAVAGSALEELRTAAQKAHLHATELGVATREVFTPGLDPSAVDRRSSLILFDGQIPSSGLGLGSRRLTAIALQRAQAGDGAIVVIDEIEHGLEPHRLCHLIRSLRKGTTSVGESSSPYGQVVMSTHSSVAVCEIAVEELHVVRSETGETRVLRATDAFGEPSVPMNPQRLVRGGAEAVLARRLVVAEGKTEVGICRALDVYWAARHPKRKPLAETGTVALDGGGSEAPRRALGFTRLGFETALFIDSDKGPPTDLAELVAAGIAVIRWDSVHSEGRIARDLPTEGLQELLNLVVEIRNHPGAKAEVLQETRKRLPEGNPSLFVTDPANWPSEELNREDVRIAIGDAAHDRNWFKQIGLGQRLGEIVVRHLYAIPMSDLAVKIEALRRFAYGESPGFPVSEPGSQ